MRTCYVFGGTLNLAQSINLMLRDRMAVSALPPKNAKSFQFVLVVGGMW